MRAGAHTSISTRAQVESQAPLCTPSRDIDGQLTANGQAPIPTLRAVHITSPITLPFYSSLTALAKKQYYRYHDQQLPGFRGWWGVDPKERFKMEKGTLAGGCVPCLPPTIRLRCTAASPIRSHSPTHARNMRHTVPHAPSHQHTPYDTPNDTCSRMITCSHARIHLRSISATLPAQAVRGTYQLSDCGTMPPCLLLSLVNTMAFLPLMSPAGCPQILRCSRACGGCSCPTRACYRRCLSWVAWKCVPAVIVAVGRSGE